MGLAHLAFQQRRPGVAGEVRQPVQLASLRRWAAGSANGSIGWPHPPITRRKQALGGSPAFQSAPRSKAREPIVGGADGCDGFGYNDAIDQHA
jgi:hypothetical protein